MKKFEVSITCNKCGSKEDTYLLASSQYDNPILLICCAKCDNEAHDEDEEFENQNA